MWTHLNTIVSKTFWRTGVSNRFHKRAAGSHHSLIGGPPLLLLPSLQPSSLLNPKFSISFVAHCLFFQFYSLSQFLEIQSSFMETMKMLNLFAVMLVMTTAVASVSVSAADAFAPAPAPTSDTTTAFLSAAVASLSAFVFAFLF
ncbi:hypothetical protein L1987_81984 [Smallanthus sonchifolius]|uniref:Uncharacterized protein n=1 Tax=Smallanthus sonchifolius TaxID=185202 RepID=A0ACB8YS84_9ASTR|nr:hypothetical protein L1987_81984 [Smallanthus sonchifolius]